MSLEGGRHTYQQLLRARWFPASPSKPRTVITFECLTLFHKLSNQGKLSGYDFYETLVHLTPNSYTDPPPVRVYCVMIMLDIEVDDQKRYIEFMRIARLWKHLKMCKRGGVAHIPGGLSSVPAGGLAIECPACSHPDVNPREPLLLDAGVRTTESMDLM